MLDRKNKKEKIIKLYAEEFVRLPDTHDPIRRREFECRANKFTERYKSKDLISSFDIQMIVKRTETAIMMGK